MTTEVVKFHDVDLVGMKEEDEVLIPIRPICEGIGVHTDKQILRIKEDEVLGRVHTIRYVHDSSSRRQEMFCLPIGYVHGWLFSIEVSKVKAEIRPRLILFKQECYSALFEHFFGNAQRLQTDATREHVLLSRNKELDRIVRDSLDERKTNVLEIQSIQNRRAATYHLNPIHDGAETQLAKRKFSGQQLKIEA